MQEVAKNKIRIRHYATGEVFSMSHHDMEYFEQTIDAIAAGECVENGVRYREFDIEVASRPPEADAPVLASVSVSDDATADPVSAAA